MTPHSTEIVAQFWRALGDEREYYTEPEMVYEDPVFRIKTRHRLMFDDYFWEIFQCYPFKICHITFLTAYLTGNNREGNERVFDLRFAVYDTPAEATP